MAKKEHAIRIASLTVTYRIRDISPNGDWHSDRHLASVEIADYGPYLRSFAGAGGSECRVPIEALAELDALIKRDDKQFRQLIETLPEKDDDE